MINFKSFDDFKSHAEFFPKGRIVPNRIARITHTKTGKRYRRAHWFKFSTDTWAFNSAHGEKFLITEQSEFLSMYLDGKHKDITINLNPYGNGLQHHIFTTIDALNECINWHDNCYIGNCSGFIGWSVEPS